MIVKKNIVKRWVIIVLVVLLGVFCGFLSYIYYKTKQLEEYSKFIESEYGEMLALLENEIRSVKDPNDYLEIRNIITRMEPIVMRDDVYYASWSTRPVTDIPSRITIIRYPKFELRSKDVFIYSLRYAWAADGTELLFLRKNVQGVLRGVYKIAFKKSSIQKKYKDLTRRTPEKGVPH